MAFKIGPGFEARNSFLAANSLRKRAYGVFWRDLRNRYGFTILPLKHLRA